ncbi:MAG: PTS system mannose/fructose/sorbose family transporter subunit IID [Candidatus Delongbacteria bacterium]
MVRFSSVQILKLTFRTFYIRLFYNYKNLFGEGLCYCIIPFFKTKEKNKYRDILLKHMDFFNTNEYMSGFAIGIVINSELHSENSDVGKVKSILSSTLGAIGDNLVYKHILPVLVLTASNAFVLSGFKDSKIMPVIIVCLTVLFNIFNFYIRYYGIRSGMEHGLNALKYFRSTQYKNFIRSMRIIKSVLAVLLLAGLLIRIIC